MRWSVANNGDEDELGTIVPIFEVVDLDAADNDDRVKHVATLQAPESLSPEGLLFVNDSKTSGHMFVTNEVSPLWTPTPSVRLILLDF